MAVVELCDRMVSLLIPLLTTERTKITIQHGNIGEWHWRASHQDPDQSPCLVPSPTPLLAPLLLWLTLASPAACSHFLCAVSQCEGTSQAVDCKSIVRNPWAWEKLSPDALGLHRKGPACCCCGSWLALAGIAVSLWYSAVAVALQEA